MLSDYFKKEENYSENYKLFSADENPFGVYGVKKNENGYYRLPVDVAEKSNSGVVFHNYQTAGGRIRFITDAKSFSLCAEMQSVDHMSHFAMTGSGGFDIYADSVYRATIIPEFDMTDHIEGKVDFKDNGKKQITINFPTYAGVKNIYLAFPEDTIIEAPIPYTTKLPIVFYGSSITQGGCSSRPGNTYEAIISRRLDFDYINLGFSGSARAEDAMVEYISNLEMSAFVLDYDHNAPDVEHLKNTHEKMFRAVREKNPDLPILMMTRPKVHLDDDEIERRDIVERTYKNAVNSGDENVYFIPGDKLISADAIECATVDNTHPNDSGFLSMANAMETTIKVMLKL